MRSYFCKFFVFLVFLVGTTSLWGNRVKISVGQEKNRRHFVERKSLMLFSNLLYLMDECDEYRDAWHFRKKNINLYLVSKGEILEIVKARRDLIREIEKKIEFFDNKKIEYAHFMGKLYKLAEPFIESSFLKLKKEEIAVHIENFIEKINDILPEDFSDNYFNDQLQELKKVAPQSDKHNKVKKYALGICTSFIALVLLVKYRKSVYNLFRNFFVNQLFKPLRNLKNCLFAGVADNDLLDMSVEEILQNLEVQKDALQNKIKQFILLADPQVSEDALHDIVEQAKKEGFESFVVRCIRVAQENPGSKKTGSKPGWIEWFLIGNRFKEIFGMPPKEKLLELEIKGLLSRLAATKLLYDAKDGIDSNKLTIILGSMLPVCLATYGCYNLYNKIHGWYYGISKKKKDVNEIIFKMSDIINRNMGNTSAQLPEEDQGLLCYLAHRFKLCLIVVPETIRSSFEKNLFYISSGTTNANEKLQILQSMKIMLYAG